MKQQKGYIYRKYTHWYVRYMDDVLQSDGTVIRKLVSKRLPVDYPEYRTKASVRPFALEALNAVNSGKLNAQSTMLVTEFVDRIYLPQYVEKQLRAATRKQYGDVWNNHLKARMGKLSLRNFRTVHGEQMLAKIAEQAKLGRSSLRHCKAFLSGAFKQAKRLGILDGLNPIQDVSIPWAPEPEDTYAHNLPEIKAILSVLPEPARTVVLTAALTGLCKSEIRGLNWEDFDGKELTVKHSVWNSVVNEPKTRRSRAPIPVVTQLAEALEAHKLRMGKLAVGPIFQGGTGKPLNVDNLVNRVIKPALSPCTVCRKSEEEHKPEGHVFERDNSLPQWHGWHAFRRGLATNLHELGVDDKTIQGILRHSNLNLTMNVYVKSVSEKQVTAMDQLSEKLGTCTELAPSGNGKPN
jgi:integrase